MIFVLAVSDIFIGRCSHGGYGRGRLGGFEWDGMGWDGVDDGISRIYGGI